MTTLTDNERAELALAHGAAAVDVSEWLGRDDLHDAAIADPVVATWQATTELQESAMDRDELAALAGHLTIRALRDQSGDDQVGINRILNAYTSFAGAITALIAVPGGAPYVWAYQLRELLDQLTAELGKAES